MASPTACQKASCCAVEAARVKLREMAEVTATRRTRRHEHGVAAEIPERHDGPNRPEMLGKDTGSGSMRASEGLDTNTHSKGRERPCSFTAGHSQQ